MSTRNKPRPNEGTSAVTNSEQSLNLLSILPRILKIILNKGNLLTVSEKRNLRLTCKDAKAAVDPYLTTILLCPHTNLSDSVQFEAFRRSSLILAAKRLECTDILSKDHMTKINRIPFEHVREVDLLVDSGSLDLVPLCKWHNLRLLDLGVIWNHDLHFLSEFNAFWESFSKAKWPFLETLVLDIDAQLSNSSDEDNDDFLDYESNLKIGGVACLLSYFPKLRNLKIHTGILKHDIKAFADVPHSNIECVEIDVYEFDQECGGAAALAEAKWPRLQELTLKTFISKKSMVALLKAPWILNLKKLSIIPNISTHMYFDAAKELIDRLQFGALESLDMQNCTTDILLAFEKAEFPKLKVLSISIEIPIGRDEVVAFDRGFSCFFSTANLPCLESFTAKCIYGPAYNQQALSVFWKTPPAGAKELAANPFRILPSLTFLCLSGFDILKECAKFLASGFYNRGCEIDLEDATVKSGVDETRLFAILSSFHISKIEFDRELEDLGLYRKVYWYALLSMDELYTIALSLYLSKLGTILDNVVPPEIRNLAVGVALEKNSESNALLQRMHRTAHEALAKLNKVVFELDKIGGSGGGGASGS